MKIILTHDPDTGEQTITTEGMAGSCHATAIGLCVRGLVSIIRAAADGDRGFERRLLSGVVGVLFDTAHKDPTKETHA